MLDDLYYLRERARQALARGDLDDATNALITAAAQTNIAENDYVAVLRPLEDVLLRRGDARSALTVLWYMMQTERDGSKRAVARNSGNAPPVDRARTLAALGDMVGAAREMENAGLVAAAAIYKEKAMDWVGARALWSRLAQVTTGGADAYNAALVQFNLARCAKQCKDARQAHDAIVASVRLVEEAADHFESVGQRERAFDCFQVLVQIGRESGMFEDVLEGFVNCIRILREDHLKYFALQYFEDALAAAKEQREFSAAATIAREVSDYARALGMAPTSAHYVLEQAELWREVAKQHKERGAPPEIGENALLAAVLAFGDAGQYSRVGKLYEELATMDLEPARKRHYARASKRYEGVRDEPLDAAPLPTHLRQDNQFPDVWHVDLIEWEQQGSAAEACADVLLDKRWPGHHPAQGDARAPHGVRGRGPPRRRLADAHRDTRSALRAARPARSLRRPVAARAALRADRATRARRRARRDADALLQAELRHRADGAARSRHGRHRASGARDRGAHVPARVRSLVAHRARVLARRDARFGASRARQGRHARGRGVLARRARARRAQRSHRHARGPQAVARGTLHRAGARRPAHGVTRRPGCPA